jgi:hypothetical protein
MITPTVGRRVWFWPNGDVDYIVWDKAQPCDAGVLYVVNERCVNLLVSDHEGHTGPVLRVPLLQDDDPIPETSAYATWMPYQVGQAKKHERPGYQLRVMDEKAELDLRLRMLNSFLEAADNPVFLNLPLAEKARLAQQASVMTQYSDILGDRITAFS